MDNRRDILNKLANGEVVKAANGDEYIVLSSVDSNQKTKGTKVRAEEYAIKVSDFLANVGVNTFEELIDTPTYAGNQLKALRINASATAIESYTASDVDSNSWGMDTVAFVSPTANFGTGAIGFANTQTSADTPNTAFRTVAEANASGASLIFLLPGYHSNVTAVNGKTYFAYPGARIYRFRDGGGSNITARLLGHATIEYGIEMSGSDNNFEIEVDEMIGVRYICAQAAGFTPTLNHTCKIKAKTIDCSGNHGGAWATRPGTNGLIEIECDNLLLNYWVCSTRSAGGTFKLRCPNVVVRSGGPYGNQYKSLINHQGSVGPNSTYDIDFMGGTFETFAPITSSFGIVDSALLLWVQTSTVDTSTVRFANGRVKANDAYGILALYQNRRGEIELDNIDLSSNVNGFSFWNQAINQVGQNVNVMFKNCNIESELFNVVGNARFVKFYNTNIKVNTGTEIIQFKADNGATPGTAYFYNCNFDLVDPGEVLTNFTGISVGLANCYGDQPVGATVVDLYGGYTQLTPFELPNLLP
jgi:hypothetical protein